MERTENSVRLVGNLGADPRVRWYDPETCAAWLSVATHSSSYVDSEGREQLGEVTDWHSVVCYRGLAKEIADTLYKGDLVLLEGRIAYLREYDQRGRVQKHTIIIAHRVELISRREKESASPSKPYQEHANDPYGKYRETLAQDEEGLPF